MTVTHNDALTVTYNDAYNYMRKFFFLPSFQDEPFSHNDNRNENKNYSHALELTKLPYNIEISRLQDLQIIFNDRCKEFAPKKRKSFVERAVELHFNYGEAV